LAKDVTCRVHSEEAYNIAVKASEILYGKGTVDALQGMSDQDILSVFAGVPQTIIARGDYEACTNITDLVSTVTNGEVYASKGEARRAIQGNALSVNKSKVPDPNHPIDFTLLNNKYLLLGKGKKNHLLIVE
jgi:tyrosyl-tRNA synthetase